MQRFPGLALALLLLPGTTGQQPEPPRSTAPPACLIVKCGPWFSNEKCQKWFRQIDNDAVTSRPSTLNLSGGKFEQVESINFSKNKKHYSVKDLELIKRDGVRLVVLNNKYTATELESAKRVCAEPRKGADTKP